MREIKFRIWDGHTKSFFDTPDTHYLPTINIDEKGMITFGLKDDSYVLMQYTGLKDKNGKEICEGDIVKYKNWFQDDSKFRNTIVVWNGYYYHPFFQDYDGHYSINSESAEIIGNIYDNFEFLK